jgi:hypothetical protein
VIKELLQLDFTLDPTFTIYLASRDLMRRARADWHDEYTLPQLWDFYTPNRDNHGSFFFDWGTEDEVAWRENYQLWMAFVNDYKNRGGRVTVGSDSGFIYQLYGFGTIQELELLREAASIRSKCCAPRRCTARRRSAQRPHRHVEPGKLADLAVLEENPLANLKVLYGTGHIRLGDDGKAHRVGGVKYTIKDGIIYDAKTPARRRARDGRGRESAKRGITPAALSLSRHRPVSVRGELRADGAGDEDELAVGGEFVEPVEGAAVDQRDVVAVTLLALIMKRRPS